MPFSLRLRMLSAVLLGGSAFLSACNSTANSSTGSGQSAVGSQGAARGDEPSATRLADSGSQSAPGVVGIDGVEFESTVECLITELDDGRHLNLGISGASGTEVIALTIFTAPSSAGLLRLTTGSGGHAGDQLDPDPDIDGSFKDLSWSAEGSEITVTGSVVLSDGQSLDIDIHSPCNLN